MQNQIAGTLDDFFELLCEMRGSRPLDLKLVRMLVELQGDAMLSLDAQKVLLIYFSLLNDGNTCISLNAKRLLEKWTVKWNGLVIQAQTRCAEDEMENFLPAETFAPIFELGCSDLLAMAMKSISQNVCAFEKIPLRVEEQNGESFLFADKYWKAKETILQIFGDTSFFAVFKTKKEISDVEAVKNVSRIGKFELKPAQAKAILCGQESNLIITGGPGTGKTTVVQFLLWNLLKTNPEMQNWSLFFVAPSGKAANRLGDVRKLEDISETEKIEYSMLAQKLGNVEGQTMHRLLSFSPAQNAFTYNKNNRLPARSIFVVDEASMIDVTLFAAFLEALPQTPAEYRLFILGDKNQLPSVEAGAVLGEILGLRPDATVELSESNRFPDDSQIGRFAKSIQSADPLDLEKSVAECGDIFPWECAMVNWPVTENTVRFSSLSENDEMLKKKNAEFILDCILGKWAKAFYVELPSLAAKVHPTLEMVNDSENIARKELWNMAEKARILSAERRGVQGVESINNVICRKVRGTLKKGRSAFSADYFPGQILMFTRNQPTFKLYNGDSGVIVKDEEGIDYLMVEKNAEFVCFPLSLFPKNSLETAFAITIHKSQGSGYSNILMFLPLLSGHPLLNRQILYTGITRVKMKEKPDDVTSFAKWIAGSLTVISSLKRLKESQRMVIERDTGIWKN